MLRRSFPLLATALLLAPALSARAADNAPGTGLHELADTELNAMRGRYTVDDHTVAWFGVTMISTWQTASGQLLQGTLAFGMDFGKAHGQPTLTFTPSVTLTRSDAPVASARGRHRHGSVGPGKGHAGRERERGMAVCLEEIQAEGESHQQ